VCTALISVDPGSRVPVLLVFARDEMAERAWLPPGHHWPEHQELVAGMDLREGGTWLAARSGAARDADGEADASAGPRVVALLNGFGVFAAPERRRTRGRLPLLVASGAPLADLDLTRYDPFHLLVADDAGVSMLTWDGVDLTDQELAPGTHLVSNRGLEVEGDVDFPRAPERAVTLIEARIKHFRPLLRSVPRPEPRPGRGTTDHAWAAWMRLADGDGLDTGDVRALIGRHDWGEGQAWMTSSVTLIGVRADGGVRYDLNPAPGEGKWSEVDAARTP
jgi:hypothetical protein